MKNYLFKGLALLMAVSLFTTCFVSCKKDDGGNPDEITKGSVETPDPDDIIDLNDVLADVSEENEATAVDDSTTKEATEAPSTESNTQSKVPSTKAPKPTVAPTNNSQGTAQSGISQEDIVNTVKALGYEYDADQKVFYSVLNPWQRHFGFGDAYDEAAVYANMRYLTFKLNFVYHGLEWQIQCWKGQYGVLAGGEMGVYTREPGSGSDFYECASDENLLEMEFDFYKTISDYPKNLAFTRHLQEHWWLTGFQFGQVNPKNCVMKMKLNARDKAMADGIEKALLAVTDKNGNPNPFVRYTGVEKGSDFYIRRGNTFEILWVRAGYPNYQ